MLALARNSARIILVIAAAGCTTEPMPRDVAGDWTATVTIGPGLWLFDMTLTRSLDSLAGTATVTRGSSPQFMDDYRISGHLVGDSVFLAMHPVEDATINVRGVKRTDTIAGELWFNSDSLNRRAVTFSPKGPLKL